MLSRVPRSDLHRLAAISWVVHHDNPPWSVELFIYEFPSPLFQVPIWLLGYVFILSYMAARVLRKPLVSLRDDKVFRVLQLCYRRLVRHSSLHASKWWMFLIRVALLALDNFRNKNGGFVRYFRLRYLPRLSFDLCTICWPQCNLSYTSSCPSGHSVCVCSLSGSAPVLGLGVEPRTWRYGAAFE